jgi:hypothetical protein
VASIRIAYLEQATVTAFQIVLTEAMRKRAVSKMNENELKNRLYFSPSYTLHFTVSVWPNTTSEFKMKTALDALHYREGFMVYWREGASALVCVDKNLDDSLVQKIGHSLCKNTSYE